MLPISLASPSVCNERVKLDMLVPRVGGSKALSGMTRPILQTGRWGRRPVCGAALLCWVANAFRQSCSYGLLARGGGCNRAEPAYGCSTLEAWIELALVALTAQGGSVQLWKAALAWCDWLAAEAGAGWVVWWCCG